MLRHLLRIKLQSQQNILFRSFARRHINEIRYQERYKRPGIFLLKRIVLYFVVRVFGVLNKIEKETMRINAATFAAFKCIPTPTTSLDRLSTILRVLYTKLYQSHLYNSYPFIIQVEKDDICESFGFIAKKRTLTNTNP